MSVRIERMSVRNVGPLRELVLEPADVTVIYGENEAGKTSCIDALTRALRDRVRSGNRKLLDHMREGPGFAGEVELVLSPADGGPVVELLREHPSLARLFIVRDGEASLEGGRTWLDAIRGRLVGIDLNRVADRVRNAAALDPAGKLRETRRDERQRLSERLTRLEAFLADLPGIGTRLEEVQQLESDRTAARARAGLLRAAERYERYRLGREMLAISEGATRTLRDHERYTQADLSEWRKAIEALRTAAALEKDAEQKAANARSELDLASEELRKRKIAAEKAAEIAADCARRDLPSQVERARRARDAARGWSSGRTPLAVLAVLLLAGAIAAAIELLRGREPAYAATLGLAAGAFAVGGVLAGVLSILATRRMRAAAEIAEQVLATCGVALPRAANLEECAAALTEITATAERTAHDRSAAAEAHRRGEQTRAEAETLETERRRKLDEVQRRISLVRDRVGLASIEQLEEKIGIREQATARLAESRRTLRSLLGEDRDEIPAEHRLRALEVEDPGTPPNPGELKRLEEEIESLDDKLLRLRLEVTDRRERALASIGLPDLGAAEAERERLREAIAAIDRDRSAAEVCVQVLRELASDIDRPLREALGAGPGGAGTYLARLTSGGYRSVVLGDDGGLAVERADGTRFGADALSRGARDQLALAVRLALVRRLLGEPGFLVLDDAFLSSDPGRREALAASLADLSEDGWQILYFTFDPVMRDRLARLSAKVVSLSHARAAVA